MSFADKLRGIDTPEKIRERVLQELERNPGKFAERVAGAAEAAIRMEARARACHGETAVAGHLCYDGQLNTWYLKLFQREIFQVTYFLADRVDIANNDFLLCRRNVRSNSLDGEWWNALVKGYHIIEPVTVPLKTVELACAAVREKLRELGFRTYKAEIQKQDFYRAEYEMQKKFFGKTTRSPIKRYDTSAAFLWIEAGW